LRFLCCQQIICKIFQHFYRFVVFVMSNKVETKALAYLKLKKKKNQLVNDSYDDHPILFL
jgi:hypothetical protein